MVDFGLLSGLAQSAQYDERINDLYKSQELVENAKERARNRAKLFADDTAYNNAINAYDHSIIKDYSMQKIKELGAWARQNPGWDTDPMKYSEYRQRINELKDNELLHKGLRVDKNIKDYEDWYNDPRNAPMRNRPEVYQYKAHLNNYLTTGSVDGVAGNNKEFKFIPPEKLSDITPTLMKYATNVKQNGVDYKFMGPGTKSRHMFVTSADKALAAKAAIDDYDTGHIIQTNYNHYVSSVKPGQKPMSIEQYVIDKMEPFFDTDKYDQIHYQVKEGAAGAGAGAGGGGFRDYFKEMYERGKSVPTVEISAGVNGTRERLLGKNGALNTNGSFIKTAKGDWIPFSGGLVSSDNVSTSGTKFIYRPNKGGHLSYTVKMPFSQFENALGGANVFDEANLLFSARFADPEVRDTYKDYGIRITKDSNGKDVAEVDLWMPTEANNTNEHAAYNHGMGAKPEEIMSAGEVGARPIQGPDGTMWQQGADGNLYGSNGMVYSPDGKRLK